MQNQNLVVEVRPLALSTSNIAAVQTLFDSAPRYFTAIQGNVAKPFEASEALTIRPPKTEPHQKHNLGIYADSELVGYVDLIDGYPSPRHAYLGLLLFGEGTQRTGLGRAAFQKVESLVQSWPHIEILRLGVADTNDVTGFWEKMGLVRTGRLLPCQQENIKAQIIEMEMRVRPYLFRSCSTLEGRRLSLSPIRRKDLGGLAEALITPTTWFSKTRGLANAAKFIAYFEPMVDRQDKGESLTLVARLRETGEFAGMSTFQYPAPAFRKVEIGFSWVADRWQGSFVNSEMKLLMLSHAFEDMKTNRVEFSVHPTNEKSNAAMKRLGATLEGTLRKWRMLPGCDDGHRNMYSIIDDEWWAIKKNLEARLS
jgi:RimJ/RimL family protein N-acetyltransferase